MLSKSGKCLQSELDDFFDLFPSFTRKTPTQSALTQARQNLDPTVFKSLNTQSADIFYSSSYYKRWKGHRVLAVDGSTLNLPSHPSITEEFGIHNFGPNADSPASLATISYLYDVYNGLVIDSQIGGYKVSESDLCFRHVSSMKANDIVLFDRFYASFPLMFSLTAQKVHFCFRMKEDWWNDIEKFSKSNKNDQTIEFKLPKRYAYIKDIAEDYSIPEKITVRLIKRVNRKGEKQVYCTSLIDKKKYNRSAICNMYKERWTIEEAYKFIKERLEVEDFSGKTAIAVKQDFYAKTLMLTLNRIMCGNLNPDKKKISDTKRIPIINSAYACTKLKRMLPHILNENVKIETLICSFESKVKSKIEYSRKGQCFPRKFKLRKKYNSNCKST